MSCAEAFVLNTSLCDVTMTEPGSSLPTAAGENDDEADDSGDNATAFDADGGAGG